MPDGIFKQLFDKTEKIRLKYNVDVNRHAEKVIKTSLDEKNREIFSKMGVILDNEFGRMPDNKKLTDSICKATSADRSVIEAILNGISIDGPSENNDSESLDTTPEESKVGNPPVKPSTATKPKPPLDMPHITVELHGDSLIYMTTDISIRMGMDPSLDPTANPNVVKFNKELGKIFQLKVQDISNPPRFKKLEIKGFAKNRKESPTDEEACYVVKELAESLNFSFESNCGPELTERLKTMLGGNTSAGSSAVKPSTATKPKPKQKPPLDIPIKVEFRRSLADWDGHLILMMNSQPLPRGIDLIDDLEMSPKVVEFNEKLKKIFQIDDQSGSKPPIFKKLKTKGFAKNSNEMPTAEEACYVVKELAESLNFSFESNCGPEPTKRIKTMLG